MPTAVLGCPRFLSRISIVTEATYSHTEEVINSLTHGIGVGLSVVGTALLVTFAAQQGDPWKIISFSIFGFSLTLLYAASTLYHGFRNPALRRAFKMLDHCAIFILIAGTYTPFLLVNLRDSVGWTMFAVIWGLALLGVGLKIAFVNRFKLARVMIYVFMGWLVMFASRELLTHVNDLGFYLLLAGGITYTAGVVFYLASVIPYNHAIWHLFVVGGSVCHFLAVFYGVLPYPYA